MVGRVIIIICPSFMMIDATHIGALADHAQCSASIPFQHLGPAYRLKLQNKHGLASNTSCIFSFILQNQPKILMFDILENLLVMFAVL